MRQAGFEPVTFGSGGNVLSLTVVRMVPIFLALAGTGESSSSKLFLGWFGPVGWPALCSPSSSLRRICPGAATSRWW